MSAQNRNNKIRESLKQEVRFYCKHSTIHGVNYLYNASSRINWSTWCLILLCSAGLNLYLNQMIWEQYAMDPTVTVVESTHYPTNNLAFPAIVLCPGDLVYGPRARGIQHILTLRGFTNSQIANFLNSISNMENLHYTPDSTINKMHSLLEDIGYPLLTLLDQLSKPCEVLLVKCMWRSRAHNCSEMFYRVLTHRGYCCRFDIHYFRSHTANDTNLTVYSDRIKSMSLVIDGENELSNGTKTDSSTELFLFDSSDNITIIDSSVTLGPKTYYDVSIDMSAMDASTGVKDLPVKLRKCILPTDFSTGSTSYMDCVAHIMMKEIVTQCKCLPYFIHIIPKELTDYPNCSWYFYRCVIQTRENFAGSSADTMSFQNCYQKCDFTQYEMQIEYVQQYAHSPVTFEFGKNAYSELNIHISDNTCMKYRREVLFTWDQLLANIGGIFGLCMGGSIISIIELLWFIITLIYTIISEQFSLQRFKQKIKTTKVFTITESTFIKNIRDENNQRGDQNITFLN